MSEMRSTDTIFDLLKNEEFVLWVFNPREESNHYWSKWMTANPERREDVETARQFILSSRKQISEKMPDEGYDYILEKVFSHGQKTGSSRSSHRKLRFWQPLRIAAAIAVLIVSIFIFLEPSRQVEIEDTFTLTTIQKEAPLGRKITTRLPDGSTITLNSGSRISFPEQFSGDSREITLIGEAYFEVEHNPEKPFIVSMNGDHVRVLGTSFNIRSYKEDSIVQVSVATGRVAYTISSGESVILMSDQLATYDLTNRSLVTGQVDRLQAYGWKDNIIYFKGTPFSNVLNELERWYGVEIEAHGSYKQIGPFSGEFRNENLIQVLNGLSFIYKFDFRKEGKKVILDKKK
ncbi:MAG: FecR family protein [Bacteroidota bacterium]